jgi:hypothetical protein
MTKKMKTKQKRTSKVSERQVQNVCAVYDPFCKASFGAKRPSGPGVLTLPLTFRSVFTVTTGTGGDAYFAFVPGPNPLSVTQLSPANDTWTAVATPLTTMGTFPNFAGQVRVVSAGLTWHDIAPMTATGGDVIVMPISDPNSQLWNNATHTLADLIVQTEGHVTDRRKPGTFILTATNQTLADAFLAQTVLNDSDDNPWPGICLYVSGAASSNVLRVEVVVHYEVTIDATAIAGTRTQTNPSASSILSQASSQFFEGGVKYVKNKVHSWARNMLNRTIRSGISTLTGPIYPMIEDYIPEVD